jgi:CBS domain-containing protein
MKCGDLMNMDLRVIPATATVKDAAITMRDNALGFLPVCGGDGRLVGVLTDRDVALRAATLDRESASIPVSEVMTARPTVCKASEGLGAVEARMVRRGVSRVVVVDDAGYPIGVVSLTDILAKDRKGRALRTAREVLAREAAGPHTPVESITLTASVPWTDEGTADGFVAARAGESVIIGGSETRGMKEFPR